MSNKNKSEEMLNKTKEQFEKLINNVDKEKIKSFGSKFSMKQLKNYTKLLLVGSILFLGIFIYWNYDHNYGKPGAIKYTNKDGRDAKKRISERWGY